MFVQRLPLYQSEGHLLLHNIANSAGQKVLAKGTRITAKEIAVLAGVGLVEVVVAVLEAGDVHEDEAATRIAATLAAENPTVRMTRAVGGRVNFHSDSEAVLYCDTARLLELNLLYGVTLAVRPPYSAVGKSVGRTDVATLKIIPYALSATIVESAITAIRGIVRFAPLPPQKVALLIPAQADTMTRIQKQFELPTRTRMERLGSVLGEVRTVPLQENAIATAATELLTTHDALFIGGQTSIMDEADITIEGLRQAGIGIVLHGVPVEPGNMLALGYKEKQWVLCAPGCAKSLETNVVDILLPRLLAGEQLDARATAALGAGGLF